MCFVCSWTSCNICIWFVCLSLWNHFISISCKTQLVDDIMFYQANISLFFCVPFRISFFHLFYIDDISHNKIATQSYTYSNYDASRAVDGNTATCMQTDTIGVGPSFPHKTVWWRVDLGGVYNIYAINIQFKNYEGYGLYLYTIYIHVTLYYLL